MTKMLKFMKPHSKVVSPERLQKQKELFGYNESCYHGFPAKSSALAWDPRLHLLALATKTGQIRVYGKEGVEFYGKQEESAAAVIKLCFLPGQGALVSLCNDNSLHLWKFKDDTEKGRTILTETKSTSLEGKLKKISSIVVEDANCKNLLVGTEGGNIYILDLVSFTMTNDIIYQDVVMQNVPEDYKVNPGPVEIIAPHPIESSKILIGYQRGLIVLWDRRQLNAEQTYISNQQLESLCWNSDASEFISSHNDGSYVIWSLTDSNSPRDGPTTVYGPFPCKPINKISWKKNLESYITVFGGGMPRANYGDRHTVTVMQDDNHVTFNITSRVIDFLVTEDDETGDVSCLVILAEEEIIFVDLISEGWPTFQNPYLSSLHSSAVTCSAYISKVDSEIMDRLKSAGDGQRSCVSSRNWPISGGNVLSSSPTQRDILLTGHEDGTVRFWDASGLCLSLLYKLSTSSIFVLEEFGDSGNADDDDWPPFRKVGYFDPFSDDPRLAVKKLEMCPHTGQLVVAGTAGQIIVLEIGVKEKEVTVQSVEVNLVAEMDAFVWKSHSKLDVQKSSVKFGPGMQPLVMMQFYPPASCTSLNLHSEWGLLAAGTAHGFALFDYVVKKNLLSKSTLGPLDIANAADEGPFSRRKSLKKSLRESFRRLRKGRSQKKAPAPKKDHHGSPSSSSPQNKSAHAAEDEAVKPMERAVEARSQLADYIGSMVRCLHLTKCYIASNQQMSATLWAGTNSGAVYIFTIAVPPSEKRLEMPLTVQLGKEIHLKHGAPVVNIMILDGANAPFPHPMAVKRGAVAPPDTSGPHRVFITSEEQFKVFTLPQLKPYCKFKVTAQEGSRVRKVAPSEFMSTADKNYKENCAMVITNQGDVSVYSLPDARKQVMAQCMKKEDIGGIDSVVFTKRGEALYLVSSSELLRISLSAEHITAPSGKVVTSRFQIKTVPAKVDASPKIEKPEEVQEPEEPQEPAEEKVPEKSPEEGPTPQTTPPLKKAAEEPKENGDTSILSGDITIDSIRDHMDEMKPSEKVMEVALIPPGVVATNDDEPTSENTAVTTTTVSTIKEEESSTMSKGSVTVVKTSNVTFVSSQETTSVQVVETNQNEENHAVNGTEVPEAVAARGKKEAIRVAKERMPNEVNKTC